MQNEIEILKGIHPGFILERELKNRNLSKRKFAISIEEHYQSIWLISKGQRNMNLPLSLKIERALNMPEGFLMTLQVFHSIKILKNTEQSFNSPDLSLIRKALFWDTDIQKINWEQQKRSVIKRVFERGNDQEKAEIERYYGNKLVSAILKSFDGVKSKL
jgi:plasmid maintenance system antidote protein VapI